MCTAGFISMLKCCGSLQYFMIVISIYHAVARNLT